MSRWSLWYQNQKIKLDNIFPLKQHDAILLQGSSRIRGEHDFVYFALHPQRENPTNPKKPKGKAVSKLKSSIEKKLLNVLHILASLYAGACLSIAVVDLRFIISFQSKKQANETLSVFSPMLKNMGLLMVPLLVGMFILCVVLSIRSVQAKSPLSNHFPLLIYLGIVAITLIVHIPINTSVFSGSVSKTNLADIIRSWDNWHWVRTALAIALPPAILKYDSRSVD